MLDTSLADAPIIEALRPSGSSGLCVRYSGPVCGPASLKCAGTRPAALQNIAIAAEYVSNTAKHFELHLAAAPRFQRGWTGTSDTATGRRSHTRVDRLNQPLPDPDASGTPRYWYVV